MTCSVCVPSFEAFSTSMSSMAHMEKKFQNGWFGADPNHALGMFCEKLVSGPISATYAFREPGEKSVSTGCRHHVSMSAYTPPYLCTYRARTKSALLIFTGNSSDLIKVYGKYAESMCERPGHRERADQLWSRTSWTHRMFSGTVDRTLPPILGCPRRSRTNIRDRD